MIKKGKSKSEIGARTSKSKKNFYLIIYNKIKQEGQIAEICKEYGIKKQNLTFYLNKLKSLNIIDRVDTKNTYLGFKVIKTLSNDEIMQQVKVKPKTSKSKSSLGTTTRPRTNLHALQINFPILSGKIKDSDWDVKEILKNWIPKYTTLKELGGLRLKNNNNKSLTVWASSRDIREIEDIHNLGYKIRTYMYSYFKLKHNVELDHLNCETKNLDVATEDKMAESMRGKGEKFTLNLNKTAEKIFEQDKIPAKAWIDGSPFNFSAETNDLSWKREYLNMPFNIRNLLYSLPALEVYNKNIELHLEVQKNQLKTNRDIQQSNKKLQESLDKFVAYLEKIMLIKEK